MVGDTLVIDADHEESEDEETATYVHRERQHRTMARRVQLSEPIDTDGVDASMRHGVLTVTVPKIATAEQGTKIEVD